MSRLTLIQRQRLGPEHFGDPLNKRFVVMDQEDLNAVAGMLSRATNRDAVQSRVIRIARTKGLRLPDSLRDPRVVQGTEMLRAAMAAASPTQAG